MNNETICAVLLNLNIKYISKMMINYINIFECQYFWKLLHARDHMKKNNIENYYDLYKKYVTHYVYYNNIFVDCSRICTSWVIPNDTYFTKTLTTAYKNDINLHSIPTNIGLLINLIVLNVGSNHLKSLSSELGLLVNLNQLFLSDNKLLCLPNEIGLLIDLNEIDISNNLIHYLPIEMKKLTKLIFFWGHNSIFLNTYSKMQEFYNSWMVDAYY